MNVKGKILEWGNSWGIRLNKTAAVEAGFRPNEEVELEVKSRITTGADVWGTLKTKVDTEQALKEIDEMFEEN